MKRPCLGTAARPRCSNPARYRGRCGECAKRREHQTHGNKRIYNSRRWKLARRKQLHDHPLCGCGAIATDVDHVIPIEEGGDIWAPSNHQSLCAPCHSRKTRREQA